MLSHSSSSARGVAEDSADATDLKLFTIFSTLLAIGTLLHQGILGELDLLSHHTPLTLSAFWLLLKPTSLIRFLTMSTMQLLCCLMDMPFVVNHWLLLATMNLAVFLCIAVRKWSCEGGLRITAAEVYREAAPVLRVLLLLTYFFAMLAKLNSGFLDTTLSSAVALYGTLADKLPFVPAAEWTAQPAIWMTILIEAFLPVFLFFRRTRPLGLVTAIGFHLLMSLAGFTPFSGLALAMLSLFVPRDFPERVESLLPTAIADRLARMNLRPVAYLITGWMFAWLICLSSVTYGLLDANTLRSTIYSWFPRICYLHCLALLTIYVAAMWQGRGKGAPEPAFRFSHPAYLVMPCLLLLNGLCPYLGLKTECSFTMYSNLQTEADQWNHLLMPSQMRLFSYQDELARVLESNHPDLIESIETERKWVHFELCRRLEQFPEATATYEYRGKIYHYEGATADRPAEWHAGGILRKIFWFRQVAAADKNGLCH